MKTFTIDELEKLANDYMNEKTAKANSMIGRAMVKTARSELKIFFDWLREK